VTLKRMGGRSSGQLSDVVLGYDPPSKKFRLMASEPAGKLQPR
jgi:hypothetical protein